MKDIMSIYEVRRNIDNIYDTLEMANCHILENSLDIYDYDNLRKAWELCRQLKCSKWTNEFM